MEGAGGHRRERSDPGIRARLAGAALRASALTPIARGDTALHITHERLGPALGEPGCDIWRFRGLLGP